jgi:thiamine thiazole synthase
MIEEVEISREIVTSAIDDFLDNLEVEVAIAGGGPSGLIAAKYLAEKKIKVALFERKLSLGGGIWGGGMMFPRITIQEEAKFILEELGVKLTKKGNLWVANSLETVAKLLSGAIEAGARIFNALSIEDVMIKKERICGVVINWSAVEVANLHVDPLGVGAKFVVDATGHPAEICRVVEKKVGKLHTPSGKVEGEKSMWAEKAEKLIVDNTGEVYPGLYVAGMAANAVFGVPRMGPIFGGMFLSGKKAAELISKAK